MYRELQRTRGAAQPPQQHCRPGCSGCKRRRRSVISQPREHRQSGAHHHDLSFAAHVQHPVQGSVWHRLVAGLQQDGHRRFARVEHQTRCRSQAERIAALPARRAAIANAGAGRNGDARGSDLAAMVLHAPPRSFSNGAGAVAAAAAHQREQRCIQLHQLIRQGQHFAAHTHAARQGGAPCTVCSDTYANTKGKRGWEWGEHTREDCRRANPRAPRCGRRQGGGGAECSPFQMLWLILRTVAGQRGHRKRL